MKTIYHIHNEICGHATNTLREVVDYALKHNYARLVFTEHSPLDDNQIIFRPSHVQIANLRRQINKVNSKYRDKLKIEFGYEIEYPKIHREYFHSFVYDLQCDFLIFGNHFYGDMWKEHILVMDKTLTKKNLDEYWESSQAAIKSDIFSLFAHPDIWMSSYAKWDKNAIELSNKLIKLCEAYNMPMGFNGNGLQRERNGFNYPVPNFWKLVAESKVKVLIEADSHDLMTMTVEWLQKVKNEALRLGLKNNLVDDIKLRYLRNQ